MTDLPTYTPAEGANYSNFVTDFAAATANAVQTFQEVATWEVAGIAGSLMVGATLLLGLTKNIPGWGPLVHTVGQSILSKISKPEKVRKLDQQKDVLTSSAMAIIQEIEAMGEEDRSGVIGGLKKRISESTSPEFNAIFDTWKKDREEKRKGNI